MRKSLIMGTKEDVARMRNRNVASKRALSMTNEQLKEFIDAGLKQSKARIVTFNHPAILGE